jgi:DNA-binding SARP family transcriptional activator
VTPQTSPYRLRTFSTLALLGREDALVLGTHGSHGRRLALLAVLAAAGKTGKSRDQLLLLFWPDATQSRARHSLDQLLYALRGSLGDSVFASTNPVRLASDVIASDVADFDSAIENGDLEKAAIVYRGPFLDGFHLGDAPEFERWLDAERARLASSYANVLERLAANAESADDQASAVRWCRKLVEADPVSSQNATRLVRALMKAGDYPAALKYAEQFEAMIARELGTSAAPSGASLVAEVRAEVKAKLVSRARKPASTVAHSGAIETLRVRRSRSWVRPLGTVVSSVLLVATAAFLGAATHERRPTPTPLAAQTPRLAPTKNIAAYELYIRGRDPVHMRSPTDSGPRYGLALLEQAVLLDPGFALAYASMPYMYYPLAARAANVDSVRTFQRRAISTARKALSLDPSSPETHAALGVALSIGLSDLTTAESELRLAIDLGGTARVREHLSKVLMWSGRHAEALTEALRSAAEDPLSASAAADVGEALCANARYDEGLTQLRRLSLVEPPLLRVRGYLALCYAMQERWPEAVAELRDVRGGDPLSPLRGYLIARSGAVAEARRMQSQAIQRWERTGRGAYTVALIATGLEEYDQAFYWLGRSDDDLSGESSIMYPMFERLREDPRFDRTRMRHGLGEGAR